MNKHLAKNVNGFNTRNNFIRSMDLAHAHTPEIARLNYERRWFTSPQNKKQYLNIAFQQIRTGSAFWPTFVLTNMLDEIAVYNTDESIQKQLDVDVDNLKSSITVWASKRKVQNITTQYMIDQIKKFEDKYNYDCPDSFKTAWMNAGAFITLTYGIKYEGIKFPGMTTEESLSKLQGLALQVIEEIDIGVDDRLFNMCHFLYSAKARQAQGII